MRVRSTESRNKSAVDEKKVYRPSCILAVHSFSDFESAIAELDVIRGRYEHEERKQTADKHN